MINVEIVYAVEVLKVLKHQQTKVGKVWSHLKMVML